MNAEVNDAPDVEGRQTELELALAVNEAIGEVLKLIGRSPIVLEDVFEALLSNALKLCDAELGILFLYDTETGYRSVQTKGITPEYARWLREAGSFKANPESGLGRIERNRQPLNINDVLSEDIYQKGDPLRIATADLGGARSLAAFPMLAGEQLKGAFTIYRQTVRPFEEHHLRVVEQFSDQAVIALENARLLREATNLSEQLAELNQGLEDTIQRQVEELNNHAQLKRFLPEKIAEVVLSARGTKLLDSHRRNIVTVFCDLRRFTAFSESSEPEEVMVVLDEFHSTTSKLAASHEGTIINRLGDGVLIILNDPVPIDDPILRALTLVDELRTALDAMSARWQDYDYDLGYGIGVSYGYATIGTVGSENYQNYTAVGTVVNVASRLCDVAEDKKVLVTQRVKTEAGDAFSFESKGQLELKGLTRPITVFALI